MLLLYKQEQILGFVLRLLTQPDECRVGLFCWASRSGKTGFDWQEEGRRSHQNNPQFVAASAGRVEHPPRKNVIRIKMTTDFTSLNLREELVQAITGLGYAEPTPIQAAIIPIMLKGADVVGQAQTGTGK